MLTYYFRTTFNVANAAAISSLTFSNLIDDGAIFYLNGVEIQRVGVSNTNVTYTSLANRTVSDATTFEIFFISGDVLTNLVTGNNVLAAEVHQAAATSSDIVFGSALIGSTGVSLTRGPYLQNGYHTNTTVRWRTDANVVGRVSYGTNLASLDLSKDELTSTNEHEVRLVNLLPDTKYFYSVGTAATTLAGSNANHFFLTAPIPGTRKATRLWLIGDAGTGTANQIAVRNAYETFTGARHTDLWLMLGDNAYSSGTDAEYQAKVFNVYTNLLRKSVLWSTLGNHETYSVNPNGNHAYFDIFTLPKNGEAGGFASTTEHYYSFDYANIHFICLDSMESTRATNSAMFIWLTNNLANVTADWTIAFWHHPPYTKGSHDSDTETELVEMRQVFLPVLENAGVDLVFAGHSHCYERTFLLDRHYSVSAGMNATNKLNAGSGRENGTSAYEKPEGGLISHQGTVYSVVGSSGQATGGALNHPAMYLSLNNLGSMVLDISSNRLDAKFIREDGTTNDYFTILKLNYAPVASKLTFNVAADISTALALAGSDINRNPITFTTNSLPGRGLISNFNPTSGAFVYTPAHGFSGGGSFNVSASDGLTNSSPASVTINVQSPPDLDGDGLPDAWETTYGVSDPDADPDGDGLTNLQEYLANTNPTNAASALRITSAAQDGSGHFQMTWASIGGTRYRVQFSNGDVNGGVNGLFSAVTQHVTLEMDPLPPGTVSARSFTDDWTLTGGASPNGARHYRVQVVK
ncbi:MAG: metallophosphoesterase family protein [Pedosphaera sp.]|nr:metallophosphoesterase family protein [Pedosphaera sp.]